MQVIKKNGVIVPYEDQKVINAVNKASKRALDNITNEDYEKICKEVYDEALEQSEDDIISVYEMHSIVVNVLASMFPKTSKSYREYRNYKEDFVEMLDKCYEQEQETRYIGDKSNANTDSALVSTQRSISYGIFSSALYKKFFLNQEERQSIKDGYIYIHDLKDRRDSFNCCLADIGEILSGGFEMSNLWYNEPKSIDTAFDVISDITMSMASQEYGGFTISEVDKLLTKYVKMSYDKYEKEYLDIAKNNNKEKAKEYSMKKIKRDIEQGYQGWEYKWNTVASSRGDFPFITITFGLGTDKFSKLVSKTILEVHRNGQGKEGNKKPVLFPKLVFLYDKDLHGKGKVNEDIYNEGIECSMKTMYPDWLSLTGNSYVSDMYKKYGKVVSPMGKCKSAHVKQH